jgi:hypothetical protein
MIKLIKLRLKKTNVIPLKIFNKRIEFNIYI